MATVTRYPSSNSAVSGSWTNPTNAYADDGSVVSCAHGGTNNSSSDRQFGTFGFDAQIPGGSTINSVQIEVEHRVSATSNIAFLENWASISSTAGATNSDSAEPTTLTARTYSSYARPGGGSWTRADLLDGTFTVTLRARNGNSNSAITYEWDYVRVTVDYTAPTGSGTVVSQDADVDGVGERTVTGSGAPAAQSASASGSGTVSGSSSTEIASEAPLVLLYRRKSGPRSVRTEQQRGYRYGTGAAVSGSSTSSGEGERIVTGSGALLAGSATLAAHGIGGDEKHYHQPNVVLLYRRRAPARPLVPTSLPKQTHTGSGAVVAQDAQVSGEGSTPGSHSGTGSAAAQSASVSGAGVVVRRNTTGLPVRRLYRRGRLWGEAPSVIFLEEGHSGLGAVVAQNASTSGVGERIVTGTGASTGQSASTSGIGERVVTGSGALSGQEASTSGVGLVSGANTHSGTGAAVSDAAAVAGVGERVVTGAGAAVSANASSSGEGELVGFAGGTGALVAQSASSSGVGIRIVTGAGAAVSQTSVVAGIGPRTVTGSGVLLAQASRVRGSDAERFDPQGTFIVRDGSMIYVTADGTEIYVTRSA